MEKNINYSKNKKTDNLVDYGHNYSKFLYWLKTRNKTRQYRYEIKFISHDTSYTHFLYWLKTSPFNFKKVYTDKRVNSIYFDTQNLDMLNANIAGVSERRKVRYRWYGESAFPTEGNLEVKNKKNNLGWKDIYPVEINPCQDGRNWKSIIKLIKKQVSKEGIFYLNICPCPVLINKYFREYYESHNRKLRITIDREQRFYKQRSGLNINLSQKKHFSNIMTVEMKCNYKYRELASELLKNIPLRHSRYSKFVEGMM